MGLISLHTSHNPHAYSRLNLFTRQHLEIAGSIKVLKGYPLCRGVERVHNPVMIVRPSLKNWGWETTFIWCIGKLLWL